jgi:hypothetical protein
MFVRAYDKLHTVLLKDRGEGLTDGKVGAVLAAGTVRRAVKKCDPPWLIG